MIINQNAIKHAVLHQTLLNQVQRLKRICNPQNLNALSNTIVQNERKVVLLQYDLQNKLCKVQRRENDQQMLFGQLYEKKVNADKERASKIQENRSLLAQLRIQRQQLRNLQKTVQNLSQQKQQLEQDVKMKGQQINKIKLKKEDQYDQLNNQNIRTLSCKQQINKVKRSIDAIQSQHLYQLTLLKQSKKDTESMNEKLIENRNLWNDKSKITEKERTYFLKQTQILNQQWANLNKQKESKSFDLQQIKNKITQINDNDQKVKKLTSELQSEIKKIEEEIVKQMKAAQEIQILLFETKISKSSLKTSKSQNSKKLLRLKILKNNLLDLLSQH